MIKVSVIIAAYNIEEFIEKCILSCINQTLREIEIIVVNDGSNDNTLKLCEKYSSIDDRIMVFTQNNKGLLGARKAGLEIAKGEYVLFVDGDDWLETDALLQLYNNAKKCNSDVVLYNMYWSYDTHKIPRTIINENKSINEIDQDALGSILVGDVLPAIWAKFIRRDFLYENNVDLPSNITFGEDLAITFCIFLKKPKISYVDNNLYNYYQRSNSLTNNINSKALEIINVINFVEEQLIKNNLSNYYKKEFQMMIFKHLISFKILQVDSKNDVHKVLFNEFKKRKVDFLNNNYVINEFSNYSLYNKILFTSYNLNYSFGKTISKIKFNRYKNRKIKKY